MANKSKDQKTGLMWIAGAIIVSVLILVFGGNIKLPGGQQQTVVPGEDGAIVTSSGCSQKPTTDVVGIDVFSFTAVTGTDYIKKDGLKPTAITSDENVNALEELKAWTSNDSYFCSIVSDKLACGESKDLQPACYNNGTVTLSVFDINGNALLTDNGGANNLTIGTAPVTVEMRFQGQKDKSSYPFGGVLIVDAPTTISDVTVSGMGITPGTNFQVNEASISTSNTQRKYTIPAGFDIDGIGGLKYADVTFTPSSNPSGTIELTFIPAQTYIGKDGNFYTDVEKKADGLNTRTFASEDHFTIVVE